MASPSKTEGVAGAKAAHKDAKQLHTGTEAHGGAAHGGGFPPFNTNTFAPQLIWLTLTFVALYYLMSKVALPRIAEVVEERADRIQRDLAAAERLKGETEKALAEYEKALADAKGRAGAIAKETREKLAAETEKERVRVEGEITKKIADAEKRIGDTKAKALASVGEIAGDVAGTVVKTLIGADVGADEVKKALGKG